MAKLDVRTLTGRGSLTMEDTPLGKGGEGAVHNIVSHDLADLPQASELVVKIYYKPEEGNRREKVIAMVTSPPTSSMLAWPVAIVASNGRFLGYVMEKLRTREMKEWAHLAHTKTRQEVSPGFDVRYAVTACLNMSVAMKSLHDAGHIQGDCNESNAFAGADASVKIVDTDSAQIQAKDGRVFRCGVGKPEYTAAELLGKQLKDVDRTEATDGFAFGVMMFQMLTGGAHQTDGIYTGNDDPPSTMTKISKGILPMLRDESQRGFKPVPRVAAVGIPSRLKFLILELSSVAPHSRPGFERIITVLKDVQQNLVQCSIDSAHWYDSRDGNCGWCIHARAGQLDPWGKPIAQQITLPPVKFGESAKPTGKAPRSSVNSPRNQNSAQQPPVRQNFQQFSGSPAPAITQGSTGGQLSPLAKRLVQQANGGNSQQQSNGGSQQQQSANQRQPTPQYQTQPEPPKIPAKMRGKMTVIYQDGSYGPRPPLGALFSQNKRLWRQAIAAEWPGFLKFWWPAERSLPSQLAIWLSPLLAGGMLFLLNWLLNTYVLANTLDRTVLQIGIPLTLIGYLCSTTIFIVWWINCWTARAKAKKHYGSLLNLREEAWPLTILRGALLSLFYTITPVILGLAIVWTLVKTMIRGDRSIGRR